MIEQAGQYLDLSPGSRQVVTLKILRNKENTMEGILEPWLCRLALQRLIEMLGAQEVADHFGEVAVFTVHRIV